MTLATAKDIATIAGILIAAIAFIKGVFEYLRQGAQKRAEYFLTIQKRLVENATFLTILELVEFDDPKVADIPFKDRRELLGLFEEVSLMLNSGLIRDSVAHYMFGYYAVDCWENDNFWRDIDRTSPHWVVFKNFALQMKALGNGTRFRPRHYRF
jgi:hypothetical protein